MAPLAPLAAKLSVCPGDRVLLLDAPADSAELLRHELADAELIVGAEGSAGDDSQYDAALFWPATPGGLVERVAALQTRIRPDGAIWAVIPKKKYAAARGVALTWEQVQTAALQTDLVDNKVASISEVEYATRFVIRADRRRHYRRPTERA